MFDLDSHYHYKNVGRKPAYYEDERFTIVYKFNAPYLKNQNKVGTRRLNETFFVHFTEFQNDLVVIKFFPKLLKNNGDDKYKLVLNRFYFGRILGTVLKITQSHWKKNPKASYAFQGAPKKLNDGTVEDYRLTKRFRIYKHASFQIVKDKFFHVNNQDLSLYLLVSKSHKDPTKYSEDSLDMLKRNSVEFCEMLENH